MSIVSNAVNRESRVFPQIGSSSYPATEKCVVNLQSLRGILICLPAERSVAPFQVMVMMVMIGSGPGHDSIHSHDAAITVRVSHKLV